MPRRLPRALGFAAFLLPLVVAAIVLPMLLRTDPAPDMARLVKTAKSPMTTAPQQALAATVDGVGFPDWSGQGWKATGGRTDTYDGDHRSASVLYEKGDRTIVRTVMSGSESVDPLGQTWQTYRKRPGGSVELTFGGSTGGFRPSGKVGPLDAPTYLCGNPDDCDLSPAHLNVQRQVDGHPVVLVGWPVSDRMRTDLLDLAMRTAS